MSLALDPRQRAMLQEMGVRVWLPAAAADLAAPALPAAVQAAPEAPSNAIENVATNITTTGATAQKILKTSAPPETRGTATGSGVPATDVAGLDWPALTQAIATCQACPLCIGRRTAVQAAPDAPRLADWLLVGEPPDDADEQAGAPFAGAAGQLLDNMLKALGLSRHAGSGVAAPAAQATTAAYVTPIVKCRPAQTRNPTQAELASCENYLRREVALVQPKVILALGRFAAQGLLQGSLPGLAGTPLGQLRGQIYRYQGIPVIVSYPPSYLLRSPQHKARAWVDLCQAQEALRRGG
ncbi:phage SPO1 DNA polymerase-related protein [Rhodoferax ferrireducens T118]|uniref:Type-4 uracil-DNA glycosylase n=1 Tax=Albidiferax ferrireducens (strain ATCC BAA-621 / DSM 15236 / T118) TaxID=338969 RepID=Q222V8_ALBFT|nr:uracil-DNA glycosylase [Rhodoferax ferrireducens]ABD67945.1 phage SPO1 DNA polymerase-related protein [Rhodoferax ferrireducens T118]